MVDADPPITIPLSILDAGQGGEFKYSRDGRKIALVTPNLISIYDSAGSVRLDLHSFSPVMTESEFAYYPPVAWTLDSAAVRVIIPPEVPRDTSSGDHTYIWHLPADGSSPSTLSDFLTIPVFQNEAVFSPDTNKVAYVAPGESGDPLTWGVLHIANVDGSGDVAYDGGEIRFLAWSPDNLHFIYKVNDNPMLGAAGSPILPITGLNNMSNVQFVDPSHYLYVDKNGPNWELWLAGIDGTKTLIDTSGTQIQYDYVK
jgi:hypothetical protein